MKNYTQKTETVYKLGKIESLVKELVGNDLIGIQDTLVHIHEALANLDHTAQEMLSYVINDYQPCTCYPCSKV